MSRRFRTRSKGLAVLLGMVLSVGAACEKLDEPEPGTAPVEDTGVEQDDTRESDSRAVDATDTSQGDSGDTSQALPLHLPDAEPGRHDASLGPTEQMIPGPAVPPEIETMPSNNNLDVVRHGGRIWLAWRTAPDHFASESTQIHVVSSTDETSWRYETSFTAATDLREPRFLSLPANGEREAGLFLYLARLGDDPLGFTPEAMLVTERAADGSWSDPTPFYEPGYIPWRSKMARTADGPLPLMTAYLGGEQLYEFSGAPDLQIDLLTTSDGIDWSPVEPSGLAVSTGGGSETAFTLDADGQLFAVVRNEGGDETGWGSKLCRAPATDITDWSCASDPRKYDSPLMFTYDGEVYLIARRNLTRTGHYDLMRRQLSHESQSVSYQLDYRERRKRCSLWRYIPGDARGPDGGDRIGFMLDLPSRGDTCFPGILETDEDGVFIIYNYSSPIDGHDVDWETGQDGETRIYRTELTLSPRSD